MLRRHFLFLFIFLMMPVIGQADALVDHRRGLAAYERGDFAAALRLFGAAAQAGSADAQFHLGEMYLYQHGVEESQITAADWYLKAASNGHPRAQSMLGTLFQNGWGVDLDLERSALWYRRAAENGDPFGMAGLGELHVIGQGVPQDPVAALMWFDLAITHGGRFYVDFRDEIRQRMTVAQIDEAQRRADNWIAGRRDAKAMAAGNPVK